MKDPQRKPRRRPSDATRLRHPVTPDGRYFVARGKLWRRANPALPEHERARLVSELILARSIAFRARRSGDARQQSDAGRAVDAIRRALGLTGTPWWTDGAVDLHRHPASSTSYGEWFASLRRE